MNRVKKILIISSDVKLKEVLGFCFDGWGYEVFLQDHPVEDIALIKKISPEAIVVDIQSSIKADLDICKLLKNDFITSSIPMIALINKRQLREQLLNIKQGVDDYLIKPPDPLDLRMRIEMAIKRSQYSLYSSPLTGLPGGRIIEEVVKEKISRNNSFALGYLDIDYFKYFNDTYGYMKGDRVIMQTAYMLYSTVHKYGNSEDFIGHIGGDDFIFITSTDKYKEICNSFIPNFDRIMPFHYSQKDRDQGFIVAKDRTRKIRKLPLMSISVALVNKNEDSQLNNVVEINERLAEIKSYLKGIPGSKFMADRRECLPDSALNPELYRKVYCPADYKPLGQILVEKSIITPQQLDDALKLHWRRGVILGEILKELGFVSSQGLEEALAEQRKLIKK
ncbi:MAG: diguanylate cyclase [Candidatus Omnitrophota bacterium]